MILVLCGQLLKNQQLRGNPILFAIALSTRFIIHAILNVYTFRAHWGKTFHWEGWKTVFKEAKPIENFEAKNYAPRAINATARTYASFQKQANGRMTTVVVSSILERRGCNCKACTYMYIGSISIEWEQHKAFSWSSISVPTAISADKSRFRLPPPFTTNILSRDRLPPSNYNVNAALPPMSLLRLPLTSPVCSEFREWWKGSNNGWAQSIVSSRA